MDIQKIDKIHRFMRAIYERSHPEQDLKELLTKRDYPIVTYRHIVRAKLKETFDATLEEIGQAEGRITGTCPNHSTIINSIEQYEHMEEASEYDARTKQVIEGVGRFINLLVRSEEKTSGLSEALERTDKEGLIEVFGAMIEWRVVRPEWVGAAVQHVQERQQLSDDES